MGEALLSGLLRGDRMGTFVVADKRHDRVIELHERYGVDISTNVEAAGRPMSSCWSSNRRISSVWSRRSPRNSNPAPWSCRWPLGVTTASLEQRLPEGTPVVG